MIELLMIYLGIAALTYVLLARYRNMNRMFWEWHDNARSEWGALLFGMAWPLTIIIELCTLFNRNVVPIINEVVCGIHRRVSK